MCDESSGFSWVGSCLLLRAECRHVVGSLRLPEMLMEEEKCRATGGGCSLELPGFRAESDGVSVPDRLRGPGWL